MAAAIDRCACSPPDGARVLNWKTVRAPGERRSQVADEHSLKSGHDRSWVAANGRGHEIAGILFSEPSPYEKPPKTGAFG